MDLSGVNLTGANLTGADLTGAIFSDETIRSNILSLGTAVISWHTTGDADALDWADPSGGARAELVDLGAISSL